MLTAFSKVTAERQRLAGEALANSKEKAAERQRLAVELQEAAEEREKARLEDERRSTAAALRRNTVNC